MAGEREDAGVVLAAQEGGTAIDGELGTLGGEGAQTGGDPAAVAEGRCHDLALDGHDDAVQVRRPFIPVTGGPWHEDLDGADAGGDGRIDRPVADRDLHGPLGLG